MPWYVLAPGPSLNRETVDLLRAEKVIAVCNAYELAPWAIALVANDHGWHKRHPHSKGFKGRRFSTNRIPDVELVEPNTFGTSSNSGVLALDVARNLGATHIVMLGFDHHGTHFFGPYTNGCANTPDRRRREFELQFSQWRFANKRIGIINCTPGTKLKAFDRGDLKDYLNAAGSENQRSGTDSKEDAGDIGQSRLEGRSPCIA